MLKRGAYLLALSVLVSGTSVAASENDDCPKEKRLLQLSALEQVLDEVALSDEKKRTSKRQKCKKTKPIILM